MENYIPPFDLTQKMFDLSGKIMENLGKLSNMNELEKLPRLRKISRLKSIHSSLAIEQNTLTLEQVTDVLDGKRVLGERDDILAVKNAFSAYQEIGNIRPYELADLLKIHGIMMNNLVEEAGKLRTSAVGVFDENGNVIHTAPPARMVYSLMCDLLQWAKDSPTPMLIKSSVFHYEFEFIHPFRDGNGRMGRLWQTVLLSSWKPVFQWIPIENIIKDNQEKYYNAIASSTVAGKSTPFILFMLDVIDKAIQDILADSRQHFNHLDRYINALMSVMESYPQSAKELMEKLHIVSRNSFRDNYLRPALEAGLIGMTLADKPTSKNQMYYKL
jgi:Fic family protein